MELQATGQPSDTDLCKSKGLLHLQKVQDMFSTSSSLSLSLKDNLIQTEILSQKLFTLKEPIMTAAADIHKYFFYCFSGKIRLDISSESSARQRIHIKIKPYFHRKVKV